MENKYEEAVKRISEKLDHFGIYPKAVVGKYEERTEYMNGWNAAMIKVTEEICGVLEELGIEE